MEQKQFPADIYKVVSELGLGVKKARRAQRISQASLAAKMGVSVGSIQRIENGEPGISISMFAMAFATLDSLQRFQEVLNPPTEENSMPQDQLK